MGFILIAVLAVAWIDGRHKIVQEKKTRTKLIHLAAADASGSLTPQQKRTFKQLCIQSAAGTRRIERAVRDYAQQAVQPASSDSVFS